MQHHAHEQEDKEGNTLTHLGLVRGLYIPCGMYFSSEYYVTIDRANQLMMNLDRRLNDLRLGVRKTA